MELLARGNVVAVNGLFEFFTENRVAFGSKIKNKKIFNVSKKGLTPRVQSEKS